MKSNFNATIISCFLAILMLSCEVELSHTVKNVNLYEEKVLVHGFISIPEGVKVNVQKSLSSYHDQSKRVQLSEVLLYKNNEPWINLFMVDSCTYVSTQNVNFSHTDSYKIYLKTVDGLEITSEAQNIPPLPHFDTVVFTPYAYDYLNEIYYEFKDVDDEKQYYYIKVVQYIDSIEFNDNLPFFSCENIIYDTKKQNDKFSGIIKVPYYDSKVNRIEVRLYALSGSLVKFLTSIRENEYLQDEAYAENVYPIYSNITNGFGIFGAYAYSSKFFTVKPRNSKKDNFKN